MANSCEEEGVGTLPVILTSDRGPNQLMSAISGKHPLTSATVGIKYSSGKSSRTGCLRHINDKMLEV